MSKYVTGQSRFESVTFGLFLTALGFVIANIGIVAYSPFLGIGGIAILGLGILVFVFALIRSANRFFGGPKDA